MQSRLLTLCTGIARRLSTGGGSGSRSQSQELEHRDEPHQSATPVDGEEVASLQWAASTACSWQNLDAQTATEAAQIAVNAVSEVWAVDANESSPRLRAGSDERDTAQKQGEFLWGCVG